MENKRRVASISIIVILIAATMAIVATVMGNGTTPVGPATPVPGNSLDISVESTPIVQDASEINYLEDICATANGTIADTELCADIDVTGSVTLGDDVFFNDYKSCNNTGPSLSASLSTILNLCSTDRIIAMLDSNGGTSDSCLQVRNENTSNIVGAICEDSGIYTQNNFYFTGTGGCTTANENIGVSATANIEICSRDNVFIVADSNDNGGFSCVSFRKNGTVSDMGKFCEDSGFTSTDEVRLAPGTSTCLDSGDPAAGSLTVTATNSTMLVTNNDPHGCDIDIAETDATSGQIIYLIIVSDSSNLIAYPDIAGQQETDGSLSAMQVWSSVEFIYANDRWVQTSAAFN